MSPHHTDLDLAQARGHDTDLVTPDNAALLLIDYNTDLMLACTTLDQHRLRNNAVALARFGTAFGLPTIMTGDDPGSPLGPVMPELKAVLPEDYSHVRRQTVNSMIDPGVVSAVEATGRQVLVMAGITTDVCLAAAAVTAARTGYDTHVVIDASATFSPLLEQSALARMTQAGVTLRTWAELAGEIAATYGPPHGSALRELYEVHLAEMTAMTTGIEGGDVTTATGAGGNLRT